MTSRLGTGKRLTFLQCIWKLKTVSCLAQGSWGSAPTTLSPNLKSILFFRDLLRQFILMSALLRHCTENTWTDRGNIWIAHRYMNVGMGNEAAKFHFWDYINMICFAVRGGLLWICSIQDFLPYSLKLSRPEHKLFVSRRDLNILGQICIKRFAFLRAKAIESDIIVNFALVDFPFLRYNQLVL